MNLLFNELILQKKDTRMIDPNYVKLFKISQLTIEYLMVGFKILLRLFLLYKIFIFEILKHSQTYLTDVIGTVETQLESSYSV